MNTDRICSICDEEGSGKTLEEEEASSLSFTPRDLLDSSVLWKVEEIFRLSLHGRVIAVVGINNLNGKALYILNVVASVGPGSWMFLLSLSKVLLSTINWAICKAIDLLELLKIEEEMLSAQSRKTVKKKGSTSWCNDNPLRREEEDKEDNAEDEEAVMKARAVDDWKDYNPCRACNQKLTTCD
ncbi:unnamed protein product [Brassica oleracea var. botrytis]|uniref:(rape) hypothetical protein n=1 Tax=Brassica napus TaxID=3708 RepID=A0A816M091_BRANA|nr:unnamed protein product [Brassica napus]